MRERLSLRPWRCWPALPVLLLLAFLPMLMRPAEKAQAATSPLAAPGQLTILDKDGNAGALCPLKHTDVDADVSGPVARVTVTQQFANPSAVPVEAVYTFPLPADAAVDDMTMTIGDRIVQGEIKRKEEARAIYEAAKAQGQSAALLDQERPNIFTQSVANIMPGEAVKITIRYVHLLKYTDGVYEWS
jgi:Ca-activated chloride channel family protein